MEKCGDLSGKEDDLSDVSTKEAENIGFDAEENEGFGKGFSTSKRGNARQRPDYRRVHKYYKSSKKYWEERNRRKQVLELSRQGLTGREIAERLGICDRTVKRDMSRIKPYYERLICSYWKRLEQDRKAEVKAQLEGKGLRARVTALYGLTGCFKFAYSFLPFSSALSVVVGKKKF